MCNFWRLPDPSVVRPTGKEWIFDVLADMNEDDRMRMLMVLWHVWHVRNEIIHDKKPPPTDASTRFLLSYEGSILAIKHCPNNDLVKGKMPLWEGPQKMSTHAGIDSNPRLQWQPPDSKRVKLNVDGSFCQESGGAGAGMVLHDSKGGIIFSACRSLQNCASPLQAELLACLEGLRFALQWSQLPVDVEMDCLTAVESIRANTEDRSQNAMIVKEIKEFFGERECSITHVSRHQNAVGHRLALFGRVEARTAVWLRSGPANVPMYLNFVWRIFLHLE